MFSFDEIIEQSNGLFIRGIYDVIRCYKSHCGTSIELSKEVFIETLRYIILNDIGVLEFRDWVENNEELKKSDLDVQLLYIYKSFPTEYDESIPEKDIENLWWYVACPVDIGWKMEDGSYWFS